MTRIHIPSKFCRVGLCTSKFCHEMRQTWVEISGCPFVISPNPVGHSDKVMKHSNVTLLNPCMMHPLPYRWYSYLGNSKQSRLEILVIKPGNQWSCLWESLYSSKTKFGFWLPKMAIADANRCYWKTLTYSRWSICLWTSTRLPIHPSTM